MNIDFETLEQIPQILELLQQVSIKLNDSVEKKWLSTQETSIYLGYSKDSIDSMVKKGEFIPGIHYYQKSRKRMFDKNALDGWVVGISPTSNLMEQQLVSTIEEICSSIAA